MGGLVSYTYDTEGNRKTEKVQGYSGSSEVLRDLQYVYTDDNLLEKVTDSSGAVAYRQLGYTNGVLTNEADHNSRTTTYGYDELGRRNHVTLPDPGDNTGPIISSYVNKRDYNNLLTR